MHPVQQNQNQNQNRNDQNNEPRPKYFRPQKAQETQ